MSPITQVIQASANVTLADIPLAKDCHMAEHRGKETGTLSFPKWETTAKSHGVILHLKRAINWRQV